MGRNFTRISGFDCVRGVTEKRFPSSSLIGDPLYAIEDIFQMRKRILADFIDTYRKK